MGQDIRCPVCLKFGVLHTEMALAIHLNVAHNLITTTEHEVACVCGHHTATYSSMGDHLSEFKDLGAHLAKFILAGERR